MFTEPLARWREVQVRDRKTKIDWAEEVASLLEGSCRESQKVILVCDNLNKHTKGAFYEAFAREQGVDAPSFLPSVIWPRRVLHPKLQR